MARRKPKYPDKPHVMRPEIRKRFEALMGKKVEKEAKPPSQVPEPKWELWRWDNLEDVPQN